MACGEVAAPGVGVEEERYYGHGDEESEDFYAPHRRHAAGGAPREEDGRGVDCWKWLLACEMEKIEANSKERREYATLKSSSLANVARTALEFEMRSSR